MKILLTHRYFWPDTPPYGSMLRTIAEALAAAGHDVHVFTSQPSYNSRIAAPAHQTLSGVKIRRINILPERKTLPLVRLVNLVGYSLRLFLQILMLRPDVVSAATFPPVAAGLVASLAARLVGAKFLYHMQDIHPAVSK